MVLWGVGMGGLGAEMGAEAGAMGGRFGMLAGAAIGAATSAGLASLAFRNRESTEQQDHFLDAQTLNKFQRETNPTALRNKHRPTRTNSRGFETETRHTNILSNGW